MKFDIFISYRRSDTKAFAHTLYEKLKPKFNVFLDTDEIEKGSKWPKMLENTLKEVLVVLVVIGKNWSLERLKNEDDWVLKEIKTAQEEDKHIIPILVDDAMMPSLEDLPKAIRELPSFQGSKVHNYSSDIKDIINEVKKIKLENRLGRPARELHAFHNDRYQIENLLTESRRAYIYIAKDSRLNRDVIIRVFKNIENDNEIKEKITRLIKFSDTFSNCVPIYDADYDRFPHIILAYMPGGSLREIIKENPHGLPAKKVAQLLREIAEILLRSKSTHCNIKPSNILLSKGNTPFINPFNGIKNFNQNTIFDDLKERKASKKEDKTDYLEDLHYIAPEIFGPNFGGSFDDEQLKKVDQYMIGLLGYELITGVQPKLYKSLDELKELKDNPQKFEELKGRLDKITHIPNKQLLSTLERMIAIKPEDRFPDLKTAIVEISKSAIDVSEIKIVRKSYLRCLKNRIQGKGFLETFYHAFIQKESIKKRFKKFDIDVSDGHSLQKQYNHLQGAIFGLIEYANQLPDGNNFEQIRILEHIAQRHGSKGAMPKSYYIRAKVGHFDFFAKVLLDIVCGNPQKGIAPFDPKCKESESDRIRIQSSWEKVLKPGLAYMKSFADE
ncbi:MAG: TIR domain-containing protein [Bacteroidota bacterium]